MIIITKKIYLDKTDDFQTDDFEIIINSTIDYI